MNCVLKNSLSSIYFGKKSSKSGSVGQLSNRVVMPPDKLPNGSLYNTIHSYQAIDPKNLKSGGGKKLTAGKLSADCTFLSIMLSVFAFLPFIRKR